MNIILLIILFQAEIRQFLERFNPLQRLSWRKSSNAAIWVEALTETCFKLAKNRIGEKIEELEEELLEAPTPRMLEDIHHL